MFSKFRILVVVDMMLNMGHKNFIQTEKIVSILLPDSLPARRLKQAAEERGLLINATSGRMTRSIIVLSSNHIILSSLQPEVIRKRYKAIISASHRNYESYSHIT
jgi:extracellular matrix regulatory protein A